jgi:hypothetical protein
VQEAGREASTYLIFFALMSKFLTDQYKALLAERKNISFSRREKLLIFSVPFYITWLQIARLNGEGYRLKFEEYWRIIMLRFAMWFVVFLIVVFLYGLIQPAT